MSGTDNLDAAMRDVASSMSHTVPRDSLSAEPVQQVLIRAPKSSHTRWKEAADRLGMSLAQFIRTLADERAAQLLDCPHPKHMQRHNQWGMFCHQCGTQIHKRRNG